MRDKRLSVISVRTIVFILISVLILSSVVAATTILSNSNRTNNASDADGDGLSDQKEKQVYGTNPNVADTDGDGVPDGEEINKELDPNNADTDGDGIDDMVELNTSTNPTKADDGQSNTSASPYENKGMLELEPSIVAVTGVFISALAILASKYRD